MNELETTKLTEPCPKCGGETYAFNHFSMGDVPESETWNVECNESDCLWSYEEIFISKEHLLTVFTEKEINNE